MRAILTALLGLGLALPAAAAQLPLFDAHIHYSHDAWDLPPARAIELLREAGVRRALVSSSSDEGTQRLYRQAPHLVIPALRPYRKRGELDTWMHDESVIPYLEERLARYRYAAIGEFHIDGAEAELPVLRRIVDLARQHELLLHVHSDADAIERLFRQDPDARILWAHAGFERPARVREMMERYRSLWADLSFRYEVAGDGQLAEPWRALFLAFPDRFMVGTDTYTPPRWFEVSEHADWARRWLAELPAEVAARIAYRNGEALFGELWRARASAP